jgi:hypothetical protein
MVHFFFFNIFLGSFFDYIINSNFKIFQSQMNNLLKKIILKKDTKKNILKTKSVPNHITDQKIKIYLQKRKMEE